MGPVLVLVLLLLLLVGWQAWALAGGTMLALVLVPDAGAGAGDGAGDGAAGLVGGRGRWWVLVPVLEMVAVWRCWRCWWCWWWRWLAGV